MKKQLLILFGAIGAFCVFAAPPIVSDVEVGNVHGRAVYMYIEKSYLNESGICAWYQRFMSKSPKYIEGFPCPYIFTCQVKTETLVSGDRDKRDNF